VRASADSQVALISLGADCAVGVVGKICIGVPTDGPICYKSDSDMSRDEMIRSLMKISAMSLPEEPHKYYSSHHTCTKTQEPG